MRAVRSALFVDFDNIVSLHRGSPLSNRIGNWLSWFEDGLFDASARKRTFLIKSAYWHPTYKDVEPAFLHAGFLTRTCEYLAGGKRGSSAVDINLAVDAIDAVTRIKRIEEVVILATDSDYVPLASALRARGVRVAIVVSDRDASKRVYPSEADIVIPTEVLGQAYEYVRPPRRRGLLGVFAAPAYAGAPRAAPLQTAAIAAASVRDELAAPTPPATNVQTTITEIAPPPDGSIMSIAEALAGYLETKGRPARAPEVIKFLRASAPEFRTNGAAAFFGRGSLIALLTEIAGLTSGRIKVFWMGPGALAARATRGV